MITICPTPIGNLEDVSERLVTTLKEADVVYAEDTRVTAKLLNHLNINKPLKRLDENTMDKAEEIANQNLNIAYCTDAGTPGVSDPGLKLVKAAKGNVQVLPGPCAAITAYVASGFIGQDFYFGGFFPRKENDRKHIQDKNCIQIYYESPNRLESALKSIATYLPNRQVSVCRELTKVHEEVITGLAKNLKPTCKGEIVIVIDEPSKDEIEDSYKEKLEQAKNLTLDNLTTKQKIEILTNTCGISKNDAKKILFS